MSHQGSDFHGSLSQGLSCSAATAATNSRRIRTNCITNAKIWGWSQSELYSKPDHSVCIQNPITVFVFKTRSQCLYSKPDHNIYLPEKDSMGLLDSGVSTTAMHTHSATMVCVSSSISLVFSLTMIVFYVSFKNLRKGSRGYLFMINVCDFACSLSFLLSSLDVPVFQCPLARLIEVWSWEYTISI